MADAINLDQLEQSLQRPAILVEREKTHGSFDYNAKTWHRLVMSAPYHKDMTEAQILALNMIYVKIARVLSNPNTKDSWKDIAGYAELGAEACD